MSFVDVPPPQSTSLESQSPRWKKILVVAVLCASSFVLGGLIFGLRAPTAPEVDLRQLWEVWNMVQTRAVDGKTLQPEDFVRGAAQGVVSALNDPYSVLFSLEESKEFIQQLEGTFEGIGAELGIREGVPIVIAPLPSTPAEKAGLRSGDVILRVDGEDVTTLSLDKIIKKIRGEAGTKVTLSVIPFGALNKKSFIQSDIKEIEIIRASIQIKTVETRDIDSRVGYIKISGFNADTVNDFIVTLREVMKKDIQGLIIDVRNNPGGFLDASVEIAGLWTGARPVVIEKGPTIGEVSQIPRRKDAPLKGMPTVVLVNNFSASASEILAGALQDYELATIVGEKTFGKGTVQDLAELDDGSLLKLTIARWFTPKNRSIDKEGIEPDIVVKLDLTMEDRLIIGPLPLSRDTQLQTALKHILTR